MKFDLPLYLASRSPRRLQLLREAGFQPCVIDSGFDDSKLLPPPGMEGSEWTQELALAKAKAARQRLARNGVTTGTILAADTVCILDGRVESQPTDRSDARRMLLAMRNARHVVITGVAILPMADLLPLVFFDQAWVTAGDIADARIDEYLDSGDWQGKAGAYNLTERQRAGWPIACDGDPATVMGLPMERLAPLLADLQSET